jgi:hypothetical protein
MIKSDHIFRQFATIPMPLIQFAAVQVLARLRWRHRLTQRMDTPPIQSFQQR